MKEVPITKYIDVGSGPQYLARMSIQRLADEDEVERAQLLRHGQHELRVDSRTEATRIPDHWSDSEDQLDETVPLQTVRRIPRLERLRFPWPRQPARLDSRGAETATASCSTEKLGVSSGGQNRMLPQLGMEEPVIEGIEQQPRRIHAPDRRGDGRSSHAISLWTWSESFETRPSH